MCIKRTCCAVCGVGGTWCCDTDTQMVVRRHHSRTPLVLIWLNSSWHQSNHSVVTPFPTPPPPSAPAAEAAQTPPPLRSTDTGARLSSVSSADFSRMASRLSDTWPFFTALISCTGHTTHSVYSDGRHDDRKHKPTTRGAWSRQPGVRSEPDTSRRSRASELKHAVWSFHLLSNKVRLSLGGFFIQLFFLHLHEIHLKKAAFPFFSFFKFGRF